MWSLVKTDIEYNKGLFILLLSVMLPLFALYAAFPWLERMVGHMMFFNIVFLGVITGNEEIKDRSNRLSALLPLPIRTIALSRVPVWLGYWLLLALLLLFSSFVSRGGSLRDGYAGTLLAYSAGMIGWISCLDINFNLRFIVRKAVPRVLLRSLAVILSVVFALLAAICIPPIPALGGVGSFLERTAASPAGSIGFLLFSLAITGYSVFLYTRRRSFTE